MVHGVCSFGGGRGHGGCRLRRPVHRRAHGAVALAGAAAVGGVAAAAPECPGADCPAAPHPAPDPRPGRGTARGRGGLCRALAVAPRPGFALLVHPVSRLRLLRPPLPGPEPVGNRNLGPGHGRRGARSRPLPLPGVVAERRPGAVHRPALGLDALPRYLLGADSGGGDGVPRRAGPHGAAGRARGGAGAAAGAGHGGVLACFCPQRLSAQRGVSGQ